MNLSVPRFRRNRICSRLVIRNLQETFFSVLTILIAVGFLLTSCSSNPAGPTDSPVTPVCDVTAFVPDVFEGERTEVMVPMRDCVRLATDVYLPKRQGPFPTILIRLPYHKIYLDMEPIPVGQLAGILLRLAGYAVVIQDTRGRYASEGDFVPFKLETQDGIDTVQWIEAQPWFNGSLGMFGGSYFGYTELCVANQRPECLKTIVPLVTPSSIYSLVYINGLPRADIAVRWAMNIVEKDSMEGDAFFRAAQHWPLDEADDVSVGDIPWYNEWLEHPFRDALYDGMLPPDVMERIGLPMLMVTGWFDTFADQVLSDFERVQAGENAPGDTRIIIGPWTHLMGFLEQHDMHFANSKTLLDFFGRIIEWYDHFLKGLPFARDWGPVKIYNPGSRRWADRSTLWAEEREPLSLYLAGDQGAASCQPKGTLQEAPFAQPGEIVYTYDPLDPLVNWGGTLLDLENGCDREENHCGRPDVLTFESAPLERDITIDGEIHLELTVSSTAPDTAFIGRLSLVEDNGKAYFLNQGVTTLSHRNGNREKADYTPSETVDLRIHMTPLLWTVHAGEGLRLEISSSSFPSVVQHPNVAKDWFSVAHPLPAVQKVLLLPDRPARLVFMVDPPS